MFYKTTEVEPVPKNTGEEVITISEQRSDLNVPFAERNDAKALGADGR